ncbi:uncharacterized mitochondrial protein-like protein [Tanacetum coccineum]
MIRSWVHVYDQKNHPLDTYIAPDKTDYRILYFFSLVDKHVSKAGPRGFKIAAKDPKWMEAMNEEFQALQQNQTWVLVPRPGSANIIGSKWVYRIKYNSDGTIERYKTVSRPRLQSNFGTRHLGALNYFLGLEVAYTDNGLFLTQSKYARDILKRADLYDSKPVSTPLATHVSFTADVSQFLHAPTIAHFQSVKRILRYVKGTISFGLTFSRPHTNTIIGYSDADWARCLDTRRSTYGYSIYLGGNLVSWSAKKQPTVSRSSCESEYRAMANTAAEIVWITHLLQELHALPPDRPTLLCDNKSALFMTQNPVSHKRAKHIDLDYHFIRELVHSGKLYTKFVPTNLQVADIFTKSLPRSQFETFRTMLRLGPPPFRLKGDING